MCHLASLQNSGNLNSRLSLKKYLFYTIKVKYFLVNNNNYVLACVAV